MNVSSIVNKPAYTDNGNQYNRFSGGKKVGAALLTGAAITRDVAIGAFKKQNFNAGAKIIGSKGKYAACIALTYGLAAAIGTGVGAIVDAAVNKARKTKADNTQA